MKLKKNIRLLKEPYTKSIRYWVLDIEEGDIYKITKEIYEFLISNRLDKNNIDNDSLANLIELGIIENAN